MAVVNEAAEMFKSLPTVLAWLEEVNPRVADGIDDWACSEDPVDFTGSELERWWRLLERAVGGRLSKSQESDIRELFGEIVEWLDETDPEGGADGSCAPITRHREELIASNRHPAGRWIVKLLADRLESAVMSCTLSTTQGSDVAVVQKAEPESICAACDELIGQARSLSTRRGAQSVAALAAATLRRWPEVLERVEAFVDLARRAEREHGNTPTAEELGFIAIAGVTAHAANRSLEGIQEVMRCIRVYGEPAGGVLAPEVLRIWAHGLQEVEPFLGVMVAEQLLLTVHREGEIPSDEAFDAAFTLTELCLTAGEDERAVELIAEWMLQALAAPYGPGSQRWVARYEIGD